MKLVRDLIPRIIEEDGKTCKYHVSSEDKYEMWLSEKMKEEVQEFTDNPCYEEAADIFEVFRSFCDLHSLDIGGVVARAHAKRERSGGFSGRIILEEVSGESRRPS